MGKDGKDEGLEAFGVGVLGAEGRGGIAANTQGGKG